MAQYIPLRTFGSDSSVNSDVESGRVHSGYGASRLPIRPTAGAAYAGAAHQRIFEGHLGRAAGDPNNPIGQWFHEKFYGKPEERTSITLPFSKNIGPGNIISPAETVADKIAQGHDLHYKDAKNQKDISNADLEAIHQFANEYVYGRNPISQAQAGVGAIGLAGKHILENHYGSIYGLNKKTTSVSGKNDLEKYTS